MFFAKKMIMICIIIASVCIIVPSKSVSAKEGGFDVDAYGSSIADKVQLHGYYEFEYWGKEDSNTTFDAHKIVVWMGVPVNEKVYITTELEYEHFPRLKSGGAGKSGEIKLDSAQLRITPVEGSVAYMGVYYVPFGIEYLSYPGQKNKLVTRPKVMKSGGIIPGTWSDVGIGFNQVFKGIGQIDVFYINGDAKNGGISRDSDATGNAGKSIGGRIMLDGIDGLNIGSSYVKGKYDTNDKLDSRRLGVHLRLGLDKILGIDMAPVLLGEYIDGLDEDDSVFANTDKKVSGYYAQISSRLHPLIELVGRYGQYDNDKEKDDNKKTETSVGVLLHLIDNLQIKAEYQWNGEEEANKTDNNAAVLQFVAHW